MKSYKGNISVIALIFVIVSLAVGGVYYVGTKRSVTQAPTTETGGPSTNTNLSKPSVATTFQALPRCDEVANKIPQTKIDEAFISLLSKGKSWLDVIENDQEWDALITNVSLRVGCNALYTTRIDQVSARFRDLRRLDDMQKALYPALSLYFEDHKTYPVVSTPLVLSSGCLNNTGFATKCTVNSDSTYLPYVPHNQMPGGTPYVYVSTDTQGNLCKNEPCSGYYIAFSLEQHSGSLQAGLHILTQDGVK